jgi:hypothetical protein
VRGAGVRIHPPTRIREDPMYSYGIGGLVVAVIVILLILFLLGVI